MPKDAASLVDSEHVRAVVKARYGDVPRSVLTADWSDKTTQDTSTSYQDARRTSKHAGTRFDLSGVGARHGQLSRFPQNIGKFAVKFYTPDKLEGPQASYFKNDLPTVLDPFAGHNSRMSLVHSVERNYVGHDISANFMRSNREERERLLSQNLLVPNNAKIELVEADSTLMKYPPVFDFCLTSPPFWDLEDYGDEPGQLGKKNKKSYKNFLRDLNKVVASCYIALKPGAFIAWEFNDFTKRGRFYPYWMHGAMLFSRYFSLHQIIVIDYGHGFLASFAQDIQAHHLVSKEHAYLVVAQKKANKKPRAEVREDLLEDFEEYLKDGKVTHQYALEMPHEGV